MSEDKLPADASDKKIEKRELFSQFLDNQAKEMDVRQEEAKASAIDAETRRMEIEHNKEIATQSIGAQLEDSKLKAGYFSTVETNRYKLGMVALVLFFIFMLAAMFSDNTQFAGDIIKVVIGAVGGYFAGKYRGSNIETTSPDQSNQ